MNTIEQYSKEIEKFLQLDQFNVRDAQMKLPSIKHLFVHRLISHKQKLHQLKNKKDEVKLQVLDRLKTESLVEVSQSTISQQIEKSDVMIKSNQEIRECELCIEYLEKVEKVLSSTTFDIKNIIEIMKMEVQ